MKIRGVVELKAFFFPPMRRRRKKKENTALPESVRVRFHTAGVGVEVTVTYAIAVGVATALRAIYPKSLLIILGPQAVRSKYRLFRTVSCMFQCIWPA